MKALMIVVILLMVGFIPCGVLAQELTFEIIGTVEGYHPEKTTATLYQVFCGQTEKVERGRAKVLECGYYHFTGLPEGLFWKLEYEHPRAKLKPKEWFIMGK